MKQRATTLVLMVISLAGRTRKKQRHGFLDIINMVTRFVHQVLRVRAFLALLVLSAILSGCGKSNVRWVVYDETLCADKWEYSPVNEKLKDNIVAYFKGK